MTTFTSASAARRGLVLLLVGAGWLSILGNSPPAEVTKVPGKRTGPITIQFTDGMWASACAAQATLSAPVRRALLFRADKVMHEVTCTDGSNCLPRLWLPPDSNGCARVLPDSGPPDHPPGDSRGGYWDVAPAATSSPDSSVATDATSDTAAAADAPASAYTTSAIGTSAAAVQAGPADAQPPPELWRCSADGVAAAEVEVTHHPQVSYSSCEDEAITYKIVVETADGVQSVQEYTVKVKQPGGYFGC